MTIDPNGPDAQAAYDRFLPIAKDLTTVANYEGQPLLALTNVETGTKAVLALSGRLAAELPLVNTVELAELPLIALAVVFAAARVDRSLVDRPLSKEELKQLTAEGYELRGLLLDALRLLVRAKLIPAQTLQLIERGTGKSDMASDLTQSAVACEEHLEIVLGKTPVTAEHIARAKELGTTLTRAFRPERARPRDLSEEAKQQLDARDRLWTLLRSRHDVLRRAGAWLFGLDALDENVPALLSANVVKREKAAAQPVIA